MRAFTAAAVQAAPAPGPLSPATVKANLAACVDLVERCVAATEAELVVLPETATTGNTPAAHPPTLWDLVGEGPGPGREAAAGGAHPPRHPPGRRDLRARPRARHRPQHRRAHRPLRGG